MLGWGQRVLGWERVWGVGVRKCVWGVGKCAWGGRSVERMLSWGWEKGEVGVRESVGRRMVSRPRTPTLLTPPQTLPIPNPKPFPSQPPLIQPSRPNRTTPTPISPTSTPRLRLPNSPDLNSRPQPPRIQLPRPKLPGPAFSGRNAHFRY